MDGTVLLCVLNAKHVHASPAPWCLAAGVKAYKPELYNRIQIVEVTINQTQEEILEKIVSQKPVIVNFSCYLWNIKMTLAICTELRSRFPSIVISLGGPEVSYCAEDVLQANAQIDYILSGEGETSVPAFLAAILAQDVHMPLSEHMAESILGLCGRREDGSIYVSAECVLSGAVPSPMTVGYADAIQKRIAYIETSRGCPYSCAFCLSGRCGSPRFFALDQVFEDLLRLANSGARTIKFVDRTFNANYRHANAILQFILDHYGKDIPKHVCFHFEIAGDILREETFALLEQMPVGIVQLEIGMQSFCEKTLEAVQRKTNTHILKQNIRRLLAMQNMHIHIDLIIGLPYEDMTTFAQSFNTGYELKAHMLQVGFLKLLHGSPMRTQPQDYPCEFSENPPYEVLSTPWLTAQELNVLHHLEDAVERFYNSGRFRKTAEYALNATGLSPFDFYLALGNASRKANVGVGISLDQYTEFLIAYLGTLEGVDKELLRDAMIYDRLTSNAGRIPPCLHLKDDLLARAIKQIDRDPLTPPSKDVRRGIALLYGAKMVCWVDYHRENRHPISNCWIPNQLPFDQIR